MPNPRSQIFSLGAAPFGFKGAVFLFLLTSLILLPSLAQGPARPKITSLAGATIGYSDFDKAKVFYTRFLGFPKLQASLDGGRSEKSDARCDMNAEICFGDQTGPAISLVNPCTAEGPCETNLLLVATFVTSDAVQLRAYLRSFGVPVSEPRLNGRDFTAVDPEHHRIRFVDRSLLAKSTSDGISRTISTRLIHAGFIVRDREKMEHFYKDILGFRPYWHGGMKDDETTWVSLQVPDGTDWLEFMLYDPTGKDKHFLGVMNHIALGVTDIHATQEQLRKNGAPLTEEPKIGRDGKWQLNLYDPDQTRIEFMEFTPVQRPCCSDFTAPHPKP